MGIPFHTGWTKAHPLKLPSSNHWGGLQLPEGHLSCRPKQVNRQKESSLNPSSWCWAFNVRSLEDGAGGWAGQAGSNLPTGNSGEIAARERAWSQRMTWKRTGRGRRTRTASGRYISSTNKRCKTAAFYARNAFLILWRILQPLEQVSKAGFTFWFYTWNWNFINIYIIYI